MSRARCRWRRCSSWAGPRRRACLALWHGICLGAQGKMHAPCLPTVSSSLKEEREKRVAFLSGEPERGEWWEETRGFPGWVAGKRGEVSPSGRERMWRRVGRAGGGQQRLPQSFSTERSAQAEERKRYHGKPRKGARYVYHACVPQQGSQNGTKPLGKKVQKTRMCDKIECRVFRGPQRAPHGRPG